MQYLVIGGVLLVVAGASLVWLLTALASALNDGGKELGLWRTRITRWINRADLELKAMIPEAIVNRPVFELTPRSWTL